MVSILHLSKFAHHRGTYQTIFTQWYLRVYIYAIQKVMTKVERRFSSKFYENVKSYQLGVMMSQYEDQRDAILFCFSLNQIVIRRINGKSYLKIVICWSLSLIWFHDSFIECLVSMRLHVTNSLVELNTSMHACTTCGCGTKLINKI